MEVLGLFDAYPFLKSSFSSGFFGVYELLPGFIMGTAVIFFVSLITPSPSKDVVHCFNKCLKKCSSSNG